MLKLLAFDLDDTLYPESNYFRPGFKIVSIYMQKNHNIDSEEFFEKLIELKNITPSGKVFNNVLSKYKIRNSKLVEKLIKLYRFQTLKLRLYPNVRKVLTKLGKKYKIALVTDGTYAIQHRKIENLKIEHLFETVIYTLDLGNDFRKPSDLPFRRLLEVFGVKSKESMYIGNNPDCDFIGAKKVGLKTVRINQGLHRGRKVDKAQDADFIIENMKELPSLVSFLDRT